MNLGGVRFSGRAPALGALSALLILTLMTAGLGSASGPASAVQASQQKVVSADPVAWTPDVLDGRVYSIEQVGELIVVGGSFTQVREKGANKPVLDRSGLFAFNATTGAISQSFAPRLDDVVHVVQDAGNGSVFVGGKFDRVNGRLSRKLTRLNISDGSIFSGFAPPTLQDAVKDLRRVGNQLIVAGRFSSVGEYRRRALLASLSPRTGAVTGFMKPRLSAPRAGSLSVDKIDVTPDGARLVAIGNFSIVDGQSRPQLVMFDLTGTRAKVANWATPFFALQKCGYAWWTYVRDVDIDPQGKYFVVTTSGGYAGPSSPCDVEARFEINKSGTSIAPSWRAYTGGDTTHSVAITGSAVYVGGHMRWLNNPWAGNKAGAGAVARSGIAALDPKSGIPFSWNPGRRPRGVGVFDMLATEKGLWIGSDTDWVAGEFHQKLAFFPLAGGTAIPRDKVGSLRNDVVLLGKPGSDLDIARRREMDRFGADSPMRATMGDANGPTHLAAIRGAVLIDDTVYTASRDGSFLAHPFAGSSLGLPEPVDLHGDSSLPGAAKWFGSDVAKITGLFFDPRENRLYYTMAGKSKLYWRGFSTESRVVGAARFTATGQVAALDPARVSGMFLANRHIYYADMKTGHLRRVGFARGAVNGPSELIDTSADWRSRGSFVWNGNPEPKPPVTIRVAARRSQDVLRVDVNPDLSVGNWKFRVQKKRADGRWILKPQMYRTTGPRETKTLDLRKGRYRVIVPTARGFRTAKSSAVTLQR